MDSDIHVVVCDVNVWMDAARVVGRPFTWAKFEAVAKERAANYVAAWDKYGGDSVVALWMILGGTFVAGQPMEMWSSDYIENTIFHKATQPDDATLDPDDRGLGWSWTEANDFLEQLHDKAVPQSQLVTILGEPPIPPAGSYELSRDDGLVAATALEAGNHFDIKYCLTKDKDFRKLGDPDGKILVLYPHEFVQLIRDSRRAVDPRPAMPRPR